MTRLPPVALNETLFPNNSKTLGPKNVRLEPESTNANISQSQNLTLKYNNDGTSRFPNVLYDTAQFSNFDKRKGAVRELGVDSPLMDDSPILFPNSPSKCARSRLVYRNHNNEFAEFRYNPARDDRFSRNSSISRS